METAVRRLGLVAACFSPLILAAPSRAVILYSSATRNAIPAPGSLAAAAWNLEGQWGNFLGTPIAPNYFMTATHVGGDTGSPFTFRGINYTIDASFGGGSGQTAIAGSDLRIWKVNETFPTYAPLYGTSDEGNKGMIIIGRGTQRDGEVNVGGVLKGWTWGDSDFVQSWGENTVTSVGSAGSALGDLMSFEFNAGVTDEATISGGDSSGGVFIKQGAEWQLAGLNYGVDGPFSYTGAANDPGFNAAIFDARGLYTRTQSGWELIDDTVPVPAQGYASRISSRLSAIYAIIPSFPIKQQIYIVEGNADVGTVDASTSVTMNASSTLRATYIRTGILKVRSGTTVQIKANGADSSVSRVNQFQWTGTGTHGKLDLNDNDLIVQSTAANRTIDYNAIVTEVIRSRTAATRWSGNGIASTAAANDPNQIMGLGAILNDNGHGTPLYSTWDGMSVDINSILIKYTLMGDLNLDNRVDADDFFLIDRGFGSNGALTGYFNGDIDYNGVINPDDFAYIDRAYNLQFALPAGSSEFSIARAVPEPSMAGFFISLTAILARRTRRMA